MMTQLTFQISLGLVENFSCGHVSLCKTALQLTQGRLLCELCEPISKCH